ncbi:MAG: dihydrodipicolinate synthase family protein [Syntrophales bacterium]|nr:dihydrodipicolinate synthase family protein [Syntrophales bacterium]
MDSISEMRKKIIAGLFPAGVPRLWCPLLTHYRDDGSIDFDRMSSHFSHIAPAVKGYLVPGSTGDGWVLDDKQTLDVSDFAVRQAQKYGIHLLLGVLKSETEIMIRTISDILGVDVRKQSPDEVTRILKDKHICGFTVCPPAGKTLTQSEITAGLSAILDLGLPTALYQLPQVTENEMEPATFAGLGQRYANVILFKDSSGQDRIALSDLDKEGIFMVRGAEGDYAKWLKDVTGPYDGFLLSTANCFARELNTLIERLESGDREAAGEISDRLTTAVNAVFALVEPLTYGNPFTNANKAIDHFFAFGPDAIAAYGPMLHGKVRLPADIIGATGDILVQCRLMPGKGYLEG